MDIKTMSKEEKKEMLTSIFDQDPNLVKDWLEEKLLDESSRQKMIEKMILEDFEKYDEVFRALA